MRLAAALAFVVAASPAQAASLTLGCVGKVTTSITPKDGVAPEPQKDFLSEYSIMVDLNQRVVFGFWFENSGISLLALPIIKADAKRVYFDTQGGPLCWCKSAAELTALRGQSTRMIS